MKTARIHHRYPVMQIATGRTGVAYVIWFLSHDVRTEGENPSTRVAVQCSIDGVPQESEYVEGYLEPAHAREICQEYEAEDAELTFDEAELTWTTLYVGPGVI